MPIYKSNGKKDGLQKYNVRVNFISNEGKYKQVTRTAYGIEAAKALERQLDVAIKTKETNPAAKMTVQKLYDEFIAAKKYEVRESTLEKHEINYRLHISPKMANMRIDKITIPKLQEWKIYMEEKGLAIKTKTNAYGTLRAMLNFAVKMEYILKNPINIVGNFKETLPFKPEMKIYTAQEFNRFITVAEEFAKEQQQTKHNLSGWGFYVFFNIAFYTGLRKGEIHALKWSDLDGAYLNVNRSITQRLKGDDRETPPKNKSSIRTLQMPITLIRILSEHKLRQMQLANFTDDYRVCGGERCLRDTSIQKKYDFFAEQAGLHHIRIHDFRHSHVSLLANEGINIQEIARRLGHARVEMTWNTYSHMYPREEEKAVNVLDNIADSLHEFYTNEQNSTPKTLKALSGRTNTNHCNLKVLEADVKAG